MHEMFNLQVVMKLAPDRKKFMEVIGGTGDINADIEKFCTAFSPLLVQNHKFLVRSQVIYDLIDNHLMLLTMLICDIKSIHKLFNKVAIQILDKYTGGD
jgi:hypothetical protein